MLRRLLLAATALAVACGQSITTDDEIATTASALSSAQCSYFTHDGKVSICHYTGSAKKPYNLVQVSTTTCITGHTTHLNDFVSVTGDCNNPGCLPDGAPADTRVYPFQPPCCHGAVAFGVCQAPGLDRCTFTLPDGTEGRVQCPPVSDPNCYARACNPGTGICETSLIGGRGCGNECAQNSDCYFTVGSGNLTDPCVFPSCVLSGSVFVCAYAPTFCPDDGNACTIDWCESGVGCQHSLMTACTP